MSDDLLNPVDVSGANLEEAINNGLSQLGLSRNEVIIEILEEGGAGFFGMGAKDALVRLIPLKAPTPPAKVTPPVIEDPVEPVLPVEIEEASEPARDDEEPEPVEIEQEEEPEEYDKVSEKPIEEDKSQAVRAFTQANVDYKHEAEIAKATLLELLQQMDVEADIEMFPADPSKQGDDRDVPWVLNIQGKDLGILIGRRGETLNSLQFITRLIVSRELQQRSSFVIDVEGYKTRREDTLRALARRMASRAVSEERMMTLEPMPPNERRIIHLALRGDRAVQTESVGSGDRRKVTIIPENMRE